MTQRHSPRQSHRENALTRHLKQMTLIYENFFPPVTTSNFICRRSESLRNMKAEITPGSFTIKNSLFVILSLSHPNSFEAKCFVNFHECNPLWWWRKGQDWSQWSLSWRALCHPFQSWWRKFFIYATPSTLGKSPKPHRFNANSFYDTGLRMEKSEREKEVFTVKCTHPRLRLKKIDAGVKHKILLFYYARCGLFFFSHLRRLPSHPR